MTKKYCDLCEEEMTGYTGIKQQTVYNNKAFIVDIQIRTPKTPVMLGDSNEGHAGDICDLCIYAMVDTIDSRPTEKDRN